MSNQKQNIVIFSFLIMSLIPFLLLTDLFPFMRFGMFAETVQETAQKEIFQISIEKKDGSIESLSNRQQVMNESHLNYLTRTYYYQNNISFLIDEITKSGLILPQEKIIITQKILKNNNWTNKTIKSTQ